MPEHADILSGLHGLRETAPGLMDLLAALGMGLLAAAGLLFLFRFFQSVERPHDVTLRLAAMRSLPGPERIAGLAALLRELTDHAAPGEADWTVRASRQFDLDIRMLGRVKAGLYAPGPPPEPDALEQAVMRALSRSGA